jgi:serine protease AprX
MMRMTGNHIARACRALVFGTAVLALTAPAYAEKKQVDSVVQQALEQGGTLPVIVRYKDDAGLQRGKAKLGATKGNRAFGQARALAAKVDHRKLRELLADDDVAGVSYDAPVRGNLLGLTTTTGVSVEASGSKVARTRYGATGAGVNVAVIDSGVQPHTDLPLSRIKMFVDFVNGKTTPYDDYGHGTHVAGIIAGSGAASSGKYAGVAPSAGIVALKVLRADGSGSTSTVMAALEWVLANHARYNVRVVNLSLGHPIFEAAATDPLVQLVERVKERGILVAVAAGNMGNNALGQTVYGSITSPANAQGALAVGASDTKYTLARGDDAVASFSSRGPTRYDYYAKPDVVAPGYHVVSLLAPGSYLATKYSSLQVGSSYFRLNGTSMAAPVAAGAAALLFSANPALTANAAKGVLQFTAQRMKSLDIMTQGTGQVNVAGAVRLAKLIVPSATVGKRWVKGSRKMIAADLLFGETAYWGRALVAGATMKAGSNALYVNLAQWADNIVWGYLFSDNIVWGYLFNDNIVWGMLLDENIVWGMDDENMVWGLTDDNIVWGFDDSTAMLLDNIVWGMDENIAWGLGVDSVLAFSTEEIMGLTNEDSLLEGGK